METIKSCPFCGKIPQLIVVPPHKHIFATMIPDCKGEAFIECECTAAMSGDTVEKVIKKWNHRVDDEEHTRALIDAYDDGHADGYYEAQEAFERGEFND